MNINEIKSFLEDKPGYLKKSAEVLSGRLECDVELCETALYEMRKKAKEQPDDNANNNDSVINEFQECLDKNGINPTDHSSVKFWQTLSGKH